MTSDEEAQNAARTSQAAAAAAEFTTADIHAGMSIQLSELSVRCWLRGIHESYGEHAADVMSLFAYTHELAEATLTDFEEMGVRRGAARAIMTELRGKPKALEPTPQPSPAPSNASDMSGVMSQALDLVK